MRALLFATMISAGVVGCGADPCGSYGGKSCINLEVRGPSSTQIDELHVIATAGFTLDARTSLPNRAAQTLPIYVAILPGEAFAGDFTLDVGALLGTIELGHATTAGNIAAPGKHVHVVAELAGPLLEADFAMNDSDGGVDLAQPPPDLLPPPDMATIPPPVDTECGGTVLNAWTAATKMTAGCDARVSAELGTSPTNVDRFGIDRIGIARAPTGRVAVVYGGYGPDGIDDRPLVVSAFTGDGYPPTVTSVAFGGGLGERQGTAPSIAAAADGTMHVCYLDTSDTGNEIHATVFSNANAFGAPESVATGQGTSGYVQTTLDGAGNPLCAWFNQSNNGVFSKRRISGVWDTSASPVRSGMTSTLAGRGAISLVTDSGNVYIAHHYAQTNTGAIPVYESYDGSANSWSDPKTVDNNLNASSKNFGPSTDLAVFGNKHAVAYFAPNASAKWDLKIATFASASDTPAYETVQTDVTDTVASAHVAIAYDPWGQLHVAFISPSGMSASLIYLRQYPDGMGGLKWLSDLVDPMAGEGSDTSSVDLIVDSRGRPHIAYYSGERGKVMYATRTDRP